MPNPILPKLAEQVELTKGVIASATMLIEGIAAKINAAVEAAIENGATAAELQPFEALEAELEASTDALAAAVAANS
jgi:hypothetical protein